MQSPLSVPPGQLVQDYGPDSGGRIKVAFTNNSIAINAKYYFQFAYH